MNKGKSRNRREFLTLSAGGVAALAIGGPGMSSVLGATNAVWTPATPINPAIDGKKVVYCINDTTTNKMMLNPNAASTFSVQNAALDSALIKANMDSMAKTLTGKPTAAEAWATIFMKPAAKSWSAVRVFMKVNGTIATIMAHIPIVGKVCEELIKLGVQGSNITVSDPGHGASGSDKYTPFVGGNGLPAGVKVSTEIYSSFASGSLIDRTGGKTPGVPVGTQKIWCTKDVVVADSAGNLTYVADIIVNFAVNKGHPGKPYIGNCTLSMKNHVGMFAVYNPPASDCPGDPAFNPGGKTGCDFLIAQNTSEAVMGNGPGYPVRQQLVVMDSLWASTGGPHDPPNSAPGVIAMSTCCGSMDWLIHDKVRKAIMGVTSIDDETVLTKFVTTFGYQTSDLLWVKAGTPTGIDNYSSHGNSLNSKKVTVLFKNNSRGEPVTFAISDKELSGARINIYNLNGKVVRELGEVNDRSTIMWDGKNQFGGDVPVGHYIVKLWSGSGIYAKKMTLINL